MHWNGTVRTLQLSRGISHNDAQVNYSRLLLSSDSCIVPSAITPFMAHSR